MDSSNATFDYGSLVDWATGQANNLLYSAENQGNYQLQNYLGSNQGYSEPYPNQGSVNPSLFNLGQIGSANSTLIFVALAALAVYLIMR